jgi:hypothetical protein
MQLKLLDRFRVKNNFMNIKKIFSFVLLIAFFCVHRTLQSAEDISCKKVLELDFGECSYEQYQALLKRWIAGEPYDGLWCELLVKNGIHETKSKAFNALLRHRREEHEKREDNPLRLQGKNSARQMVGWNDLIANMSEEELRKIVGPLDLSERT